MTFTPSERDLVVCTAKVDSAEDPVLSYGIYLIIYKGKGKSIQQCKPIDSSGVINSHPLFFGFHLL